MRFLIALCILSLAATFTHGQDTGICIPARDTIISHNKSGFFRSDTLYKKIEKFSRRGNIVSRLVRSFVVFPTDVPNTPSIADPGHREDDRFIKNKGKIIREIHIFTIDPFNSHINDTVRSAANWLEESGNELHITTRKRVIRNQLLFRQGESLEPFKLSESERLLRTNSYISDARITVAENDCDDSVDVIVWAQDIFSINGSVSGDPSVPNGSASLNDQNFLGLGNNFGNKIWYDPKSYRPPLRYEGTYTIANIDRSHISSNLFYSNVDNGKTYRLGFNKPFYSSIVTWAGGYTLELHDQLYYNTNGKISYALSDLNDIWYGHAFNSKLAGKNEVLKTQYFLCGRATFFNFINKPYFTVPATFQNSNSYLISTGVSYRDYYKDNFIFAYGKTEDVPIGDILSYTGGVNFLDTRERYYHSVKLSKGAHFPGLGYIFGSAEAGGYVYNHQWEQSVLVLQSLFFTEVERIGSWKLRQFLSNKLILGYQRDTGEHLYLTDGSGLRGRNLPYTGIRKFSTNYEADLFAPKTVLGFRTVLVLFADFGMLSNAGQSLFNTRLYQGYGIGVRLKNEHLIFPTAQFSFIFYVNTRPGDGNLEYEYYYAGHAYYSFQNFNFGQPYTLGFNY